MKKPLIIVESSTKAKTITKYLEGKYNVLASMDYEKDLSENELGINIEKGFIPKYVTIKGKEKTIANIKKVSLSSLRNLGILLR
ncbi:MAG: hypothetical protein AB1630_08050 [bacterium]